MKTKIYSKNHRTPRKKKLILAIVLGVLVVLGAGFAFYKFRQNNTPTNTVSGPTPEEINATEEHKQELANQQNNNPSNSSDPKSTGNNTSTTPTQTPSGKRAVAVTVSYAGPAGSDGYVVNAIVSGVIEAGGTCTVTASRTGATSVTKSGAAVDNVSNTNCAPITFSASELSAGDWSLKVTYASATSEGSTTSNLSVKAP